MCGRRAGIQASWTMQKVREGHNWDIVRQAKYLHEGKEYISFTSAVRGS